MGHSCAGVVTHDCGPAECKNWEKQESHLIQPKIRLQRPLQWKFT